MYVSMQNMKSWERLVSRFGAIITNAPGEQEGSKNFVRQLSDQHAACGTRVHQQAQTALAGIIGKIVPLPSTYTYTRVDPHVLIFRNIKLLYSVRTVQDEVQGYRRIGRTGSHSFGPRSNKPQTLSGSVEGLVPRTSDFWSLRVSSYVEAGISYGFCRVRRRSIVYSIYPKTLI